MRPTETCEVCGEDVAPEDAHRAELSVGDTMCPTPMTFHRACYDQAAEVWDAPTDSCSAPDPEYPETEKWVTFPSGASLN